MSKQTMNALCVGGLVCASWISLASTALAIPVICDEHLVCHADGEPRPGGELPKRTERVEHANAVPPRSDVSPGPRAAKAQGKTSARR